MSKKNNKPSGSAPERILAVATELFYKQGYRATGINEVIEKSGVAKATFYNHFPAKDDLGHAYIKTMRENELEYVNGFVEAQKEPVNRFMAVIESLGPQLMNTNFRGCAFMNMAAEITDPGSPMRKEGKILYDDIKVIVHSLSEALIASNKKKYRHLDPQVLAEEYMVIFAGAVALSELYHAIWPVEHAIESVRSLIET